MKRLFNYHLTDGLITRKDPEFPDWLTFIRHKILLSCSYTVDADLMGYTAGSRQEEDEKARQDLIPDKSAAEDFWRRHCCGSGQNNRLPWAINHPLFAEPL